MLTLSFRVTNNLSDAEDIVQEAFIHSFKQIKQLKEAQKYGSWLKRIVVNKSIQFNQKHSKNDFVCINDEILEDEIQEDSWYQSIDSDTLNHSIQLLPDGCREILTLFALENYKHKDIAELFGISVSTSKSQYQYALKLLRKNLRRSL